MTDNTFSEAFFALHRGLPRQGPGSDATTRRLLSLTGPLPARPRVLDLGCGPGRSALLLAAEAGAEVTAVDLDPGMLDELRQAAEDSGLTESIRTVKADMAELPFPDGSFDLVWAESSVYNIGFDTALRAWRRLLAPGGAVVVTECEWTSAEPSAEARAFWDQHYALRTTAQNTAAAEAAGYTVLGVVPQPESDWDEYYVPLGARAEAADPAAPGMDRAIAATREEIAMRREHGSEYGYTGYVRVRRSRRSRRYLHPGVPGRRRSGTSRPYGPSMPPRSRRPTRPRWSTPCARTRRPGCPGCRTSRRRRTARSRRTPC